MSYILDALKKAERERKRGRVPDVLTPQEGIQSAAGRPLWPFFVIAALFLNVALLLWWFAPWKTDSPKTAAVELPVQTQPDSVKTEAPPVSGREELPAPPIQDEKTHPVSPEHPAVTETALTKLPGPGSSLVPERQPVTGVRGKGSGETKKEERAKEPPAASEPAAELPPAENRVYHLKELPDQLRNTLPDFSISAFLYSDTPSSRMVRINGQMLREGEELSPGLKLNEITPDGVIMSCRTYRFSISVR